MGFSKSQSVWFSKSHGVSVWFSKFHGVSVRFSKSHGVCAWERLNACLSVSTRRMIKLSRGAGKRLERAGNASEWRTVSL